MTTVKFGLIVLHTVILIFVKSAISAKIQLYSDSIYSNLHLEVSLTDACYNLPREKFISTPASVITDTCFIAYEEPNCKSKWTRKFVPGNTSSIYTESLQICNDKEGGPQLNMDITTHFAALEPIVIRNVLESYIDVCTCVNIPKYVQNMSAWSLDNHHNGLIAYFEPDCKEEYSEALYIKAGHSDESKDMHTHTRSYRGTTIKIQSFGPAPNSTYFQQSCNKTTNQKIMNLELFEALNISSILSNPNPNAAATNLTTGANDDPIHFFSDNDYLGFHFGSRSTSKCSQFPKSVQLRMGNEVGSIITKTCVILYSADDCEGRSVKIETPGSANLTNVWESTVTGDRTLSLLYSEYPDWKWETKSYHVCNKDMGGSTLNVKIYSDDPVVKQNGKVAILESYHNLCSCRNVPEHVHQLNRWSINNNGNSIMAYFTPDCLSSSLSPLRVPPGQSSYSYGLGLFEKIDESTGITQRIQSFGPDPNSDYFIKNCKKNCTQISLVRNENEYRLNIGNYCDLDTNSENTQIGLFIVERMQAHEAKLEEHIQEFRSLIEKVDELGPIHELAALNLENTKHEFNDKLEKQRDEIQQLTDQFNSHNHE